MLEPEELDFDEPEELEELELEELDELEELELEELLLLLEPEELLLLEPEELLLLEPEELPFLLLSSLPFLDLDFFLLDFFLLDFFLLLASSCCSPSRVSLKGLELALSGASVLACWTERAGTEGKAAAVARIRATAKRRAIQRTREWEFMCLGVFRS
ncbi:MAG: hypothetical protein VKN83_07565 [Cyanobacteriota bacterium]|nr:hypothetical protein [Cyanobacteriota bacterium]